MAYFKITGKINRNSYFLWTYKCGHTSPTGNSWLYVQQQSSLATKVDSMFYLHKLKRATVANSNETTQSENFPILKTVLRCQRYKTRNCEKNSGECVELMYDLILTVDRI